MPLIGSNRAWKNLIIFELRWKWAGPKGLEAGVVCLLGGEGAAGKQEKDDECVTRLHGPNETKVSDGRRERASLEVKGG
jgi:hypothetical protein